MKLEWLIQNNIGGIVVLPRIHGIPSDLDVDSLPKISLSRNKGKCYFSLNAFSEHDGHAPLLKTKIEVRNYIQRVTEDVQATLGGCDVKNSLSEFNKAYEESVK